MRVLTVISRCNRPTECWCLGLQVAFEIKAHDARPIMSDTLPVGLQALIRACWARKPDNRPAAFEVVLLLLDTLAAEMQPAGQNS